MMTMTTLFLPIAAAAAMLTIPLLPVATALVVRSEGSGGIATGLAYNPRDDQVVVVGTTFRPTFWGIQGRDGDTNAECFVALGDVTDHSPDPKFSRMALSRPSVCLGGTSMNLNGGQDEDFGMATLVGVQLVNNTATDTTNDTATSTATSTTNKDEGFLHSVLYYSGQVSLSTSEPLALPSNLMPVASLFANQGGTMFVASHSMEPSDDEIDATMSLLGGGVTTSTTTTTTTTQSPLHSLLRYWWTSTFPTNAALVLPEGEKVSIKPMVRDAPHVRKQDIYSGMLVYDVSLEVTDGSASLIAALALPASAGGGAGGQENSTKRALIVAGSTNGPSYTDSLYGQAGSKSPELQDWDGYILFLDPDTGAVFEDENSDGKLQQRRAIRINSVGNEDDFVHGMCLSPDTRYLYVVGTTQGILKGIHKGGAFVYKMDLEGLSSNTDDNGTSETAIVWRFQLHGLNVQGLACAADAEAVYLGGSTESNLWNNPDSLQPTVSPDAFVTKISTSTGQASWTQPLDTTLQKSGDNRREVIVSMQVTNQGYILVLMNSMNLATGMNDVFLLDLDPETGDNDLHESLSRVNNNSFATTDDDILVVAIVVPVVLAMLLFGVTWWRHRTNVERLPKATQKDHAEKDQKQDELPTKEQGTELL